MPRKVKPLVRHRQPVGGVVPITAYVDPGLRQAVQVAARVEGVSQSLFIQQAVQDVLSERYAPAQMKARARKELVNA
jgi:hypothetical protein